MNIVFIGAGNLATSLSFALQQTGYRIAQVWSRSIESCQVLSERLGDVPYTTDYTVIRTDADLYVFAVTDGALSSVVEEVSKVFANAAEQKNRLFVHVAGTQPMEKLMPLQPFGHIGVFYPFQAFTRNKMVDLRHTCFFIEGDDEPTQHNLESLAHELTDRVYKADMQQRGYIHLAGVLTGNFSNCLYAIASEIVASVGLPFSILLPVIQETEQKVQTQSPRAAQSGPAMRGDQVTIEKHLRLLADLEAQNPALKSGGVSLSDVYRFFTANIQASR